MLQKVKELDRYIIETSPETKKVMEYHITNLLKRTGNELLTLSKSYSYCVNSINSLKDKVEIYDNVYSNANNLKVNEEHFNELMTHLKDSSKATDSHFKEFSKTIKEFKNDFKNNKDLDSYIKENKRLVEENNSLKQRIEGLSEEIGKEKVSTTKERVELQNKIKKLENSLSSKTKELSGIKEYFSSLGYECSNPKNYTIKKNESSLFKLLKSDKIKKAILSYVDCKGLINLMTLNKKAKTFILNTTSLPVLIYDNLFKNRLDYLHFEDRKEVDELNDKITRFFSQEKKLPNYVRRFLVYDYNANSFVVDQIKSHLRRFDDEIKQIEGIKQIVNESNPQEQIKDKFLNSFKSVMAKFDKPKDKVEEEPVIKENEEIAEVKEEKAVEELGLDKILEEIYHNINLEDFQEIRTLNQQKAEDVLQKRLTFITYNKDSNAPETSEFKETQNERYIEGIQEKSKKYTMIIDKVIAGLVEENEIEKLAKYAKLLNKEFINLLYLSKIVFVDYNLLQKIKYLLFSELINYNQTLNIKENQVIGLRKQLDSLSDSAEKIKILENTKNVFYTENKKLKNNMFDLNELILVS